MRSNCNLQLAVGVLVVVLLMPLAASGRWISVDPKAELFPSISPYAYTSNNPLRFVDPNGEYQMTPEQQRQNPKLANYLKNDIADVQNNPKIANALKLRGSFTDQQLSTAVTWGSGPTVNVTDVTVLTGRPANGAFQVGIGSSTLHIDNNIVTQLETTQGAGSDAALLLVGSTVLHETTHFGEEQNGSVNLTVDQGEQFEVDVYGQDIDTQADAQRVLNQRQQRLQPPQSPPPPMTP